MRRLAAVVLTLFVLALAAIPFFHADHGTDAEGCPVCLWANHAASSFRAPAAPPVPLFSFLLYPAASAARPALGLPTSFLPRAPPV